jgi:hypothetical protein
MGSAAMDQMGEIAIGYSRSSAASGDYPSIYYAGQTAGDHRGTTETEALIKQSTGSQPDTGDRWGDYSHGSRWRGLLHVLVHDRLLPGYRKVQLGHVARFAHIPEVRP